jgi:hypothetical protein
MNIIRKAPADTLISDAGVSMKLYSQALAELVAALSVKIL